MIELKTVSALSIFFFIVEGNLITYKLSAGKEVFASNLKTEIQWLTANLVQSNFKISK